MKIVVLNGSPKGLDSITMQYVRFLGLKFPAHQFQIIHVCPELKQMEADAAAFDAVLRELASADGVLWAFPLYVLLVHASYKRFIELLGERGATAALRDKYAAVLTTSIRFFDHTAHNYLHAICDDLGMRYVGSHSADMYDLLKPGEQERLLWFAREFFEAIERQAPMPRQYEPLRPAHFDYQPGEPAAKVDGAGRKIVVLTDARDDQPNLGRMVERFRQAIAGPVEVINLHEVAIRTGCQGCIQCSLDNHCVYEKADDLYQLYTEHLMPADVLVFAGAIHDRYLSSRWKLFFDRGFFNNHVPIYSGKQIAWLVSGPLGQIANLRQILESYPELGQANLAGIVTDEGADSRQLDGLLDELARRAVRASLDGYVRPPTFLSVAGGKLFRDEIWRSLRFVFHADHRYFKRHGFYNFPRRDLKTVLLHAVIPLLVKIPSFRREFRRRFKTEMLKPLEKVLEDAAR